MSEPRIFISYSQEDAAWVRSLAEALRAEGLDVWLDQWHTGTREALPDALEQGLRGSDAVVVLVSPESAKRPNLFFELGFALGERKTVIPVVSPDLDREMLPFDLRTRKYLVRTNPGEVAHEVAVALKEPA